MTACAGGFGRREQRPFVFHCIRYSGCLNKVQRLSSLKQQKLIFWQFWRPEVLQESRHQQGHSASSKGESFFASFRHFLSGGSLIQLPSPSSPGRLPFMLLSLHGILLCVSDPDFPLFYKDTNHIRYGPTLMTSLKPDCICTDCFQMRSCSQVPGDRTCVHHFGAQNSTHHIRYKTFRTTWCFYHQLILFLLKELKTVAQVVLDFFKKWCHPQRS